MWGEDGEEEILTTNVHPAVEGDVKGGDILLRAAQFSWGVEADFREAEPTS